MTVIAYKDGLMACDSAWSDENLLCTRRNKIARLPSGALLGEAGDDDTRAIIEMLGKVKTAAGLPSRKQLLELQIDYSAILVLPKGRIFHVQIDAPTDKVSYWSGGIMEVGENYYSVGTGREHALTAMECGKTAKEACEFAIRRNMACRPPIYIAWLVPPKPKSPPAA